jgi:hypothetical protein
MIGKPDYIPPDFASWWEVRINSSNMERSAYVVVRAPAGHEYAWFVHESHADEFARLKNDVLLRGGAN